MGKPDGFIKGSQKFWLLSDRMNMVIIFIVFVWNITGFDLDFPDTGKAFSLS